MSNRLVYVVDENPLIRQYLTGQISHYGYGATAFSQIADARTAMESYNPAVIVVSLDCPEGDMVMQLAEIQEMMHRPPAVICLSERDDVELRLRAVRFGSSAYLTRPVDMDELIGKLDDITDSNKRNPYHVLIVENDPSFAGELAAVLSDADMLPKVIFNPALTMESLIEFNADLILMNLYQPELLGMELAAVLRQQEVFQSIPIIFYSGEMNSDRQMAALRKGGDGFLKLPIQPEHLIVSVTARVKRSRIMRSLIVKDSLTGLMNHTRTREMLKREISRARRDGKELVYTLVDIDKFKRINDSHGHQIGDRVIKSLARLLRQRVWSTDLVGRYSGNVFAVISKSLDGPTAARVFGEIRVDFSEIRHQSENGEFHTTFSCGIAALSDYPGINALNDAAERALLQAKIKGGNKIALIQKRAKAQRPSQ